MSDYDIKQDGFASVMAGLGSLARDKAKSFEPVSSVLSREMLETLYDSDPIASQIVDAMGSEALRVQVSVSIPGVDAQVADAAAEWLEDSGAIEAVREAVAVSRRDGGAVLYVSTGGDPSLPFDGAVDRVEFEVISRYDLRVVERYADPERSDYGAPAVFEAYTFASGVDSGMRVRRIHESRLVRFYGVKRLRSHTSNRASAENDSQDWGSSVLQRAYDSIQGYGIAWSAITHLLVDGAQSVIKIKGLQAMVSAQGGNQAFQNRMLAVETGRSVARAVAIDADGEDFRRDQYGFGGVDAIVDRLQQHVAAAARIPVAVLFGRSPAGLNATGESDTRHFYDQVRITQKRAVKPALETILGRAFALADGPTGGVVPESYSVSFGPLEEPSAVEQSSLRKTQADMDVAYINAGVLTPEEVALNRFRATGWSAETTIDLEVRQKQLELDKKNGSTDNLGAGAESPQASGGAVDTPQETAQAEST